MGVLCVGMAVTGWTQELAISADEFAKLDTFEGHILAKADKVFADKEYRRAAAEYEAFILQYPKSGGMAYAVYRKARCLHLDNKRYEAIRAYTEVLDYFPNSIAYASAALFYLGECHLQNGETRDALKAWAEMAADEDYRKHALAAGAINRLADNLVAQKKFAEAAAYYEQVAVDFRQSNRDAAWYALNKAAWIHVRVQPDEAKLHGFYERASAFEWNPRKADPAQYWSQVRGLIREHGKFADDQKEEAEKYYRHWAGAMEGKAPDDDDFQIDLAGFKLAYERDLKRWVERLDQQFARKPGPAFGRVIKWISVFREQKEKVQEYYAKLDFAKMDNGLIRRLMQVMFDEVKDAELAKACFGKIKLDGLSENEKRDLERYLWHKDGTLVEQVCAAFADRDAGRMELLRYYHWSRGYAKGMPLADEMIGVPSCSKDAYWMKAEMFHWQAKYAEAMAAYQQADNPPHNLWRIGECFLAQGKQAQGIGQYQEIENFFPDQAPEAAMRIANVYRDAKDSKQYVAALRGLMKKYPKSGQSSAAHLELERLGIRIGGGVDAH